MTSKEYIANAEKIECKSCSKGIAMCKLRPCWGTVSDFKKIIKAGHAKKLMLEYYNHNDLNNNETVYFLCGASNGNECTKANWNPKGQCLLLVDNKCQVHSIKPTMGAVACCKKEMDKKLMHACLKTWTTKEGKKVIEDWKKMVDYVEKDDDNDFSMFNVISLAYGI